MSFEIGQKVVCINDSFEDWVLKLYTCLPKKDAVYVVRDVRIGATFEKGERKGAISLLLVGLVNPSVPSNSSLAERGFNAERFRSLDQMRELSGVLSRAIDAEVKEMEKQIDKIIQE